MAPTRQAELHVASFADLDPRTLYDLLRLRVDVFVVEQKCAYPELDGRDTEPGTLHLWLEQDRVPVAYLRILTEGAARRIGRVVVARSARGAGHARQLMSAALAIIGRRPCVLDAQSYLLDFYAGFGFVPSGPEYVEDGIPHVPMCRSGTTEARPPTPPPDGGGR
jgi:ElaA protein